MKRGPVCRFVSGCHFEVMHAYSTGAGISRTACTPGVGAARA
jgi:hypothetical protein